MDPIILHSHPEIQKMIQPEIWGYDSFKAIKIGNTGMTEYFTKIYLDCVKKGQSFDEMMKTLWKEAQEHREAIERF